MRGLAVAVLVLLALTPWAPLATAAGKSDAVAQTDADKVPAPELQAFARAARAVFSIRQAYAPKVQAAHSEIDASGHILTAQKEMEAAIRREGMSVVRYNEILEAAQRNSVLAARIQTLVDKAAQGR
jgi:hypothetical protein